MPFFRRPHPAGEVDWKSPRLAAATVHDLGVPYRFHKASGRTAVLHDIKSGETVEEWTKRQAKRGFDAAFCIGSLKKHMAKKYPCYILKDAPLLTKKSQEEAEAAAEKREVAKTKRARAAAKKAA